MLGRQFWENILELSARRYAPRFRTASTFTHQGNGECEHCTSLGACYLMPDVDYVRYPCAGTVMPLRSEFDVVCTLCARKGVRKPDESSESQVSSSTSEGELS